MATDKQTEFKVDSDSESDLDLCEGVLLSEEQLDIIDYTVPTVIEGNCSTKSENVHFQCEAISKQGTSGNGNNKGDIIYTRTVEDAVDGHLRKSPELEQMQSVLDDMFEKKMSELKDFESVDLPEYDSLHEECATVMTHTDNAAASTDSHANLVEDTAVSDSVNKPAPGKMKSSPKTHRQVPYTYSTWSSSKSAKGKQPATEKGLTKADNFKSEWIHVDTANQSKEVRKVLKLPVETHPFRAPSPTENLSSLDTTDSRSFQHKDNHQAKISQLPSEDNSHQSADFSAVSEDFSMICEGCSTHNSHNSMVECCVNHVICTQCVEKSAKAVLKGENKGFVGCSKDGCTSSIPLSELRRALPSIVLDLLEDCWKKETLDALEDMKDAVRCPNCDLPALLDMAIKQFQCTKCKKYYCRYCEIEWHLKPHELCIKTKSRTSKDTGTAIQIPAHWTDDCDKEIFTTVELDKNCHEFKEIKQLFDTSIHSTIVKVQKIFRIQNVRLWDRYCLLRSHMVADLAEMHLREMRLFHGTEQKVVDAICQEGFDWRLSGKNGTAFGKGTYFAKHASYSNMYCHKEPRSIGSLYTSVPFTNNQTSSSIGTHGFASGYSTNSGFKVGGQQQNLSSGFNVGSSQQSSGSGFNFGSSQQNPSSQSSTFQFGSKQSNITNIGAPRSNNLPTPNFPFAAATYQASKLATSSRTKIINTGSSRSNNTFLLYGAPGFGSSHVPNNTTSGHSSLPVSSGNIFDNQRWQLMFVGRVLVGRTCRGTSSMRRPGKDPLDPEGKMCHTAVDNVNNPHIFVTFDNAQCYPEYLIQYC